MGQKFNLWIDELINRMYPEESDLKPDVPNLPYNYAMLMIMSYAKTRRNNDVDFGEDETATKIPSGYGAAIPNHDNEALSLNFPNVIIIEDDAFSNSKIEFKNFIDLSKTEVVGKRAFKSRPFIGNYSGWPAVHNYDYQLPNVVSIGEEAFASVFGSTNDTAVNFYIPKCQFIGKNAFAQGKSFPITLNIYLNEYDGVCQLENENALKMSSNKNPDNPIVSTVNVYVPANQVDNYLADSKWSKAINKYAADGSEGRVKGRDETINIIAYQEATEE